ncbi:hypothetical protein [Chroococcidiopsis sp. CCMEE 29]|uniref:hypothetical protein n=1 Tax=Chroococcidiopsis sp. CCMEE 29 TaxID=155894 RepID=UPI0020226316|nr:hypothetical protein [Chroococcidiopsis sp. CCMEE 29]
MVVGWSDRPVILSSGASRNRSGCLFQNVRSQMEFTHNQVNLTRVGILPAPLAKLVDCGVGF